MRCYFCFVNGDVPRLSKEHLLSKPVAEAFGLERAGAFGQMGEAGDRVVLARLDDVAVRFVCEQCNNTWMNELEHQLAAIVAWTRSPNQSLRPAQVETLRAWSLKTYLVLSVMVGGARRFVQDPQASGVIPNFTRARQLFENDARAFDGMAFGLARPVDRDRFAYAFGNPTVVPQGERYANCKSAGLAIVSLGALQVWAVDPTIFHRAHITFPERVTRLEPALKYKTLRGMPLLPHLEDVTVDNGEHDIAEVIDRLIALTGRLADSEP